MPLLPRRLVKPRKRASENNTNHTSRRIDRRRAKQQHYRIFLGKDPFWSSKALDDYLNGFSYKDLSIKYKVGKDARSMRNYIAREALMRFLEQSNCATMEESGLRAVTKYRRCPCCNTIHKKEKLQ